MYYIYIIPRRFEIQLGTAEIKAYKALVNLLSNKEEWLVVERTPFHTTWAALSPSVIGDWPNYMGHWLLNLGFTYNVAEVDVNGAPGFAFEIESYYKE